MGDVGGLYDGMSLIARIFVGPVTALALHSELLSAVSSDISRGHNVPPLVPNNRRGYRNTAAVGGG